MKRRAFIKLPMTDLMLKKVQKWAKKEKAAAGRVLTNQNNEPSEFTNNNYSKLLMETELACREVSAEFQGMAMESNVSVTAVETPLEDINFLAASATAEENAGLKDPERAPEDPGTMTDYENLYSDDDSVKGEKGINNEQVIRELLGPMKK